ncbi:MAG: hypothetical protein ACJATL_000948 [Rickettsiales bacterium]|jgi:hypothetical protein
MGKQLTIISHQNKLIFGYFKLFLIVLAIFFLTLSRPADAKVTNAQRSGFTWINREAPVDTKFGSGYSFYSSAWPVFKKYPGPHGFQTGLVSSWLSTQRTGNEPKDFYTTIEGGLGWWHDTRFATKIPKFIMGGVSLNFYAWANGPGAGKSDLLANGQRNWSTPGGKYGVAQLSNRLLWAPDGLNMAQSSNGELLGYGYIPLPLTDPMKRSDGANITTGNQSWTLFLNATNFKGPMAFFMPTYWTDPILNKPSLEGVFLDSRPSDPNVGFGIEHAGSPGLISKDTHGNPYAKIARLQFPINGDDTSAIVGQISVYSKNALWNNLKSWFNGGPAVKTKIPSTGTYKVPFVGNGGSMYGRISETATNGIKHDINLNYIKNVKLSSNMTGYQFVLDKVEQDDGYFVLPEYFKLNSKNNWQAISATEVPKSTNLLASTVPSSLRTEIPYLTPLDPECHWQDSNGPWNKPGPVSGPFKTNMGDGTTLTYYWYRFVDQPAIMHANLPKDIRNKLQKRIELIHANWSHTDEYLAPPVTGKIATLDPAGIVKPPAGLEIGYVPIATKQEKTPPKVRIFILAGQSNMQGYGTVGGVEAKPGSLVDVIKNDTNGDWSKIGKLNNWTSLENAFLYYDKGGSIIRDQVTVGQGANANLIGPELMFAHKLDEYYDDPILIIKTAWGGHSLAVNFRPPSAGGVTGDSYKKMIKTVKYITKNLENYEISGFGWFQGWNDGGDANFYNEYESNLTHLIHDVRNDLKVSKLPIVIANSGQGGFKNHGGWVGNIQKSIAVAQENVACSDGVDGGLIGFAQTKQHYLEPSKSPTDAIYHFNNNALTFLNIGKEMGEQMILAINEMGFCHQDCSPILADSTSIGNRVWNDLNANGINDPDEPGIPNVTLVLWGDSNDDGIPDGENVVGFARTDEEGHYKFSGLKPGNYVVFVWNHANWNKGESLHGFVSTNNFVANANNDADLDNNGYGKHNTDITSGIVTLTIGGEPLEDGDSWNCYYDLDSSQNNTVDFGFYDPNAKM